MIVVVAYRSVGGRSVRAGPLIQASRRARKGPTRDEAGLGEPKSSPASELSEEEDSAEEVEGDA